MIPRCQSESNFEESDMNTTAKMTSLFWVSVAIVSSCGKTDQKVQTADTSKKVVGSGSTDASGTDPLASLSDDNCKTKDACNSVAYTVVDETGADVTSVGVLQPKSGTTGTSVNWSLSVKLSTAGAPAGRVMLAPSQLPLWMNVTNGTDKGTKQLTGIPDAPASNVQMIFIARDMIKCKVSEPTASVCTDGKQNLPAYDKTITINYNIGGSAIVNSTTGTPVNGTVPYGSTIPYGSTNPYGSTIPYNNASTTSMMQKQSCINQGQMTGNMMNQFFGPIGGIVGTVASVSGC